MENKVDDFFKNKLDHYVTPPPTDAWVRVEARLSKKNKALVWRAAAALLLMGLLVSVIYRLQKQEQVATPVAVVHPLVPSTTPPKAATLTPETSAPATVRSAPKKPLMHSPLVAQTTATIDVEKTASSFVEKENKIENIAAAPMEEKKELITDATQRTVVASTRSKPIKLEFTLDEIPSQQTAVAKGEESTSGLKKVWMLARNVKNGEGPVRDMKNEIFALNFKKKNTQ